MALAIVCLAACDSGKLAGDSGREGDGDTGVADTSEDTGDSAFPEDTSVSCTPEAQASQPQPSHVEAITPPCGGFSAYVALDSLTDPRILAFSDAGTCEGAATAGSVHILDLDSRELLSLDWPDLMYGFGPVALLPAAEAELGLALARPMRDGRLNAGRLEIDDVWTGAVIGEIAEATPTEIAFYVVAIDDGIGASAPYQGESTGIVRVFDPPWRTSMTVDDATAVHHSPTACDRCLFGSVFDTLGDVTGDGLDDALMGGSHAFWFVDGTDLRTDEGVSQGIPVRTAAYQTGRTISNVGDFDGDGIDDWATAWEGDDADTRYGAVDVLRGNEWGPFARIVAGDYGRLIAEGIGRVGDIDGNGRSAVGILGVSWGDPVEVRVVDGGLCGVVEIEDVSVLLDEPAGWDASWFASGDGLLALSAGVVDEETYGVMLLGW